MKSFFVLPSFLDLCCEANSCANLSSEHTVRTAKMIIYFKGCYWVCTGSMSQGMKNLSATLNECVPAHSYGGPAYDDESRFYTGLRFSCIRIVNLRWIEPLDFVFTGREIEVKIARPNEKNLYRAMR